METNHRACLLAYRFPRQREEEKARTRQAATDSPVKEGMAQRVYVTSKKKKKKSSPGNGISEFILLTPSEKRVERRRRVGEHPIGAVKRCRRGEG